MTKREYVTYAINNKLHYERAWYLTVFARPLDSNNFITLGDGYLVNGEVIEGSKVSEPLFRMDDILTITKGDHPAVEKPMDTTIGIYILNLLTTDALKNKLNIYINKTFGINTILDMFISQIEDDKTAKFTTKDLKRLGSTSSFLRQLAVVFTTTAKETMGVPPGLDKVKKTISDRFTKEDPDWKTSEYKALLYQDEVMEWVIEQFKDLPEYGITLNKKALKSFKKRFITQGAQATFSPDDDTVVIMESLYDGIPLTKREFSAIMNAARIGAAGRGLDTKIGGLQAKQIIRALQGLNIKGKDCKTLDGFTMEVTKKYSGTLAFLYLNIGDGKYRRYSSSEMKSLIGRVVDVRLPLYCKQPDQSICETCAGSALASNDITITGIELGGKALSLSLAKFHDSALAIVNIEELLREGISPLVLEKGAKQLNESLAGMH